MDIRSKISAAVSQLCTVLIALLGYSCASTNDEPDELIAMYGCPTGSFELKGTVTDEEGNPVDDAEIKAMEPWAESDWNWVIEAKTVTDIRGEYFMSGSYFGSDSIKIVCLPTGDSYLPDSIKVAMDYKYDDEHKYDSWYVGHATITVDFKLKDNPEK